MRSSRRGCSARWRCTPETRKQRACAQWEWRGSRRGQPDAFDIAISIVVATTTFTLTLTITITITHSLTHSLTDRGVFFMPCITPLVEPVAHPRAQEHPPRNHHPHVHSLTCPQDIGPPIKSLGRHNAMTMQHISSLSPPNRICSHVCGDYLTPHHTHSLPPLTSPSCTHSLSHSPSSPAHSHLLVAVMQ